VLGGIAQKAKPNDMAETTLISKNGGGGEQGGREKAALGYEKSESVLEPLCPLIRNQGGSRNKSTLRRKAEAPTGATQRRYVRINLGGQKEVGIIGEETWGKKDDLRFGL